MGIYIKGMTMMMMASECRECELIRYYSVSGNTKCIPTGKLLADNYKPIPFDGRPEWCPLIELPEKHGRLIDADYLMEHLYTCETNGRPMHIMELGERLACIDEVPTVIEAEGEG